METKTYKIINKLTWLLRIISLIIGIYFLFKKDYIPIISGVIFIVLSFIPFIFNKKSPVKIDDLTVSLQIILMFSATFLGKGLKLYELFFWWDIFVHFLSGIVSFGLGLVLWKKAEPKKYQLFIIFLLACTMALSWEIIEFASDTIFGADNQEWSGKIYEPFVPRMYRGHGLIDTMMDMLYAILGLIIATISFIMNKKTTL